MDNISLPGTKLSASSLTVSPKYKNKTIKVKSFLNNSINSLLAGVKSSMNKSNKSDSSNKRDQSNDHCNNETVIASCSINGITCNSGITKDPLVSSRSTLRNKVSKNYFSSVYECDYYLFSIT